MTSKEDVKSVCDILETPLPSLGLDVDGCITDYPVFFSILANNWPGKVYIITYRNDKSKIEQLLKDYNIHYNEIVLVNSVADKAKVIAENGISVFFDDQPEMIQNISPLVTVLLLRNGGNFDYESKKWLFSKNTGKII